MDTNTTKTMNSTQTNFSDDAFSSLPEGALDNLF